MNREQPKKGKLSMSNVAASSFTVTSWEEQPFDGPSDGLKITQAIVSTNFVGDITGVGSVIYIMKHQDNGTANFIGLQQINGSIGNLKGSFAIEQNGFFDGKEAKGTCIIKKGSGTGDFTNLDGQGEFIAPMGKEGSLKLIYNL